MKKCILVLLFLLTLHSVAAATVHGTIYNSHLQAEPNVLLEVDTTPQQKLLAVDGKYSFTVSPGKYTITAQKENVTIEEKLEVTSDGDYVMDLFLLPGLVEEDDLWNQSNEDYLTDETTTAPTQWWRYALIGLIVAFALYRIIQARRKYGSLRIFRRKIKAESTKTIEQHKQELAQEPGMVDKALEIIKKHDGRITQKDLRKEMLYLSEAKVSLILTELEHTGKIERVKKGRGNVILLTNQEAESP